MHTLRDCELGLCSRVETTRPRMRHPLKAVLSVQLVKTKSQWSVACPKSSKMGDRVVRFTCGLQSFLSPV